MVDGRRERLEIHDRGQAWVARRLTAAVPRIMGPAAKRALQEMHGMRVVNICAYEGLLDALPEAFRAVCMLRGVDELSVEETAAAPGIPEATVRTRFFRARSQLREALSLEIDLGCGDAFAFAEEHCDRIAARVTTRLAASKNDPR